MFEGEKVTGKICKLGKGNVQECQNVSEEWRRHDGQLS